MLGSLQLPFQFDPARLAAGLAEIRADEWSPHYNDSDYAGIWRGAALRSASGEAGDLRSVAPSFHDTALLDRCPQLREVVGTFQCRVKAVRLLGLAPGSFIREHSDHALDFEDGEARIHVPIQTNDRVEFYVQGERLLMEEGGAYYVNVNLPHRVNNRGTSERVHLVIDVEVNDWVRELFARSSRIARCAPPSRGVEEFRDAAIGDPALRETLRPIADAREFEAAAVRLGGERRFAFHEGDVDALLTGVARPGAAGGLAYQLEIRDGEPYLWWTDARPLAEPFFEETVWAALRTPWGKFSRRVSRLEGRRWQLKGLIFHMSRSGSTLMAQMLKAAGCRVASEAMPVRAALESNPAWLPAVVAALDVDFVKLDAWSVHRLPEIRAAFPETPWIFLHRDPAEVMASHRRSPGIQALPGAIDPSSLEMTMTDLTARSRARSGLIRCWRRSSRRRRGISTQKVCPWTIASCRMRPGAAWRGTSESS